MCYYSDDETKLRFVYICSALHSGSVQLVLLFIIGSTPDIVVHSCIQNLPSPLSCVYLLVYSVQFSME